MPAIIYFKKLYPSAIIPQYQTVGAACFDLHALVAKDIKESYNSSYESCGDNSSYGGICINIHPKSQFVVKTGLSVQLPAEHEMQIRPRSGLAAKYGITITYCSIHIGCLDSTLDQLDTIKEYADFTREEIARIKATVEIALDQILSNIGE
jgi:dUTP pyrophosphatase